MFLESSSMRKSVSCSVLSSSLQPCGLLALQAVCPWNCPGKDTGVDCHFLLQEIFLTQGSNPGLHTGGRFFIVWATREAWEYPSKAAIITFFFRNWVQMPSNRSWSKSDHRQQCYIINYKAAKRLDLNWSHHNKATVLMWWLKRC